MPVLIQLESYSLNIKVMDTTDQQPLYTELHRAYVGRNRKITSRTQCDCFTLLYSWLR